MLQVGLVDASGNKMATLAAAVLALDQFFAPRFLAEKDKDTYPPGKEIYRGNQVYLISLIVLCLSPFQFKMYLCIATLGKAGLWRWQLFIYLINIG